MSEESFSAEMVKLISRRTEALDMNKDDADKSRRLTKPEVLTSVKRVVEVMLGVNLQQAPKAGIIIPCNSSSPATPYMTPAEYKYAKCNVRFKSMVHMHSSSASKNVKWLHEWSSESPDEMDIIEYNTPLPPADEKFYSRSSPRLNEPFTIRSDSSIRKEAQEDACRAITKHQTAKRNNLLLMKLIRSLKNAATNIVENIEEIEKELFSQRPKRPTIAGIPGTSGSSSTSGPATQSRREELPHGPKYIRRPTPVTTDGSSISTSTSGPLYKTPSRNVQSDLPSSSDSFVYKKIYDPKRDRATIMVGREGDVMGPPTVAPGSSQKKPSRIMPQLPPAPPRPPQNPKYAHVQSTIPKFRPPRKDQ